VRLDDLAAELSAIGRSAFEGRFGRQFLVFAEPDLLDDAASFVNTASRESHEILRGRADEKLDVRPLVSSPGGAPGGRISLGRDKRCDVPVTHALVSSVHAYFTRGGGLLFVADARSKNGTRVNGLLLDGDRPTPVDAGDTLQFGPVSATLWGLDDLLAAISRK
jgi:hypothetical protein